MSNAKAFEDFFEGNFDNITAVGSSDGFPDLLSIIREGKQLALPHHEDDSERMQGFHPSQISGKSCLTFYWNHINDPVHSDPDDELQEIFDEGTELHERYQRYLTPYLKGTWMCRKCRSIHGMNTEYLRHKKLHLGSGKYGAWKKDSKIISDSFLPSPVPKACKCKNTTFKYLEWRVIDNFITGKIDGVLTIDSKDYGLEIKSAGINSFAMLTANANLVKKHKEQFSIYLDALKLERGFILYVLKGGQGVMDLHNSSNNWKLQGVRRVFNVKTEDCQESLAGIKELMQTAKTAKNMPLPTRNKDCQTVYGKKKTHCDYYHKCFGNEEI